MKIKHWLIKKLDGYTKEQYDNAMKHNFIQELECRVRNGNDVVIGVRNMGIMNSVVNMFNKETCKINKANATIKYNDLTFKIVNVTNYRNIQKLRGINLNGFFFID